MKITPVKVKSLTYDETIPVWIGIVERNGRLVKATFNITEEPDKKYELFVKNGYLYLKEISPNGGVKVYQVSWEAMDCIESPTNIACTIDTIKLHAILSGKQPPKVKVIDLSQGGDFDVYKESGTYRVVKVNRKSSSANIIAFPKSTGEQQRQQSKLEQHQQQQEQQHIVKSSMAKSSLDIKSILTGLVALLLGLLAFGKKK